MTLARTHKDGNLQIFMNEEKTVVVKHYAVRRGGCLYIGEITIAKENKTKVISSTSGPYDPDSKLSVDRDESMLRYLEALAADV